MMIYKALVEINTVNYLGFTWKQLDLMANIINAIGLMVACGLIYCGFKFIKKFRASMK